MTTKASRALYRTRDALNFLELNPWSFTLQEAAEMFDIPQSTLRCYLLKSGALDLIRGLEDYEPLARRKKSKLMRKQAGIADVLLMMPPPNFSGMSNTQSSARR